MHTPLLQGTRILSLALNLPGPAALQRCRQLGATCTKLEPPNLGSAPSSDPMCIYSPAGYRVLHEGIHVEQVNLKTEAGQAQLHQHLAQTDVLITSFRSSAMGKLGIDWHTLQTRHPHLSLVAIYGDVNAPDEAGHDLTYQAANGLVTSLALPTTLVADMAGALMASEAVLQALLYQKLHGHGYYLPVGLGQAAQWMAQPRTDYAMFGAQSAVGGSHVGYRVYRCADGYVALAALEPHFFMRLAQQVGFDATATNAMTNEANAQAIQAWCSALHCEALNALALAHDLPLVTLPQT